MLQTLYGVYSKISRPSKLFWLNIWAYSKNNTWVFLSQELLSFYIESIQGFKISTISTFQNHPNVLYRVIIASFLFIQLGLFIG